MATVAGAWSQTGMQLQKFAALPSPDVFKSIISALNLIVTRLPQASRVTRYSQLIFKAFIFLVLLGNIRSFPGAWHWRLFWVVTKVRLQYLAARTRASVALVGKRGKAKKLGMESRMEGWLDSITPIGAHPFEFETRYRSWVSLDESDFNMHMSNSSYPKVLDCARMKAAMELFPQFLRVGGVIPLAATHFHFIRELPVFANYEIRLTIGAWDEKWMYVVSKFVTKNPKYRKSSSKSAPPSGEASEATPALPTLFQHAPVVEVGSSSSVAGATPTPAATATNSIPTTAADRAKKFDAAVTARLASNLGGIEPEMTLHTVGVSRVCFKLGRITVPPGLIMATNGVSVHPWEFASAPASVTTQKYSPSNPPPTWSGESKALFSKPMGGSPRKLRDFYKGAWREVRPSATAEGAESLQWWDRAMGVGGNVEEQRRERLEVCQKLVGGLDGVRELR